MGTPRETERASLRFILRNNSILNNNFFDQISIPDSRYRIVFQLNSKQCLAACIQVKKTNWFSIKIHFLWSQFSRMYTYLKFVSLKVRKVHLYSLDYPWSLDSFIHFPLLPGLTLRHVLFCWTVTQLTIKVLIEGNVSKSVADYWCHL